MPEGVEVRKSIDFLKYVEGKKIEGYEVIDSNSQVFKKCPLDVFTGNIIHRLFTKGKFIFMELDNDQYVEVHYNMGGSLRTDLSSNTLVDFKFTDGTHLYYQDRRKFGHFTLFKTKQAFQERYNELGADILELDSSGISSIVRYLLARRSRRNIKVAIMDQYIIGGIGNIYATEGLFRQKINPFLTVGELSPNQLEGLLLDIQSLMKESYKLGGMSVIDFELPDGTKAEGKKLLKVYSKSYCPVCEGLLQKEKIGGRGTTYCPHCQHVEED